MELRQRAERRDRQLILDRPTQMESRTEAAVAVAAAAAEAAKVHTALQGFLYLGRQPRRVVSGCRGAVAGRGMIIIPFRCRERNVRFMKSQLYEQMTVQRLTSSCLAKKKCPAELLGGKQNLATVTIQRESQTRSLQSIAMATMAVINPTNPIGSIAFLPAAPVGVVELE